MYNISSHYQSIFESLKKIVKHRRVLYLFPYGSTSYENIENITDNIAHIESVIDEGPMFIFYDQEPIYDKFNYTLFDYIEQNFQPPFVLVTTERDSETVNKVIARYQWPAIDYFHHIFAASDWYRGYRLFDGIIPVTNRKLTKKFITFNRITGNSRVYRSLFVGELINRKLLNFGHISYSADCPVHGSYHVNIKNAVDDNLIVKNYADYIITQLSKIPLGLRIDNADMKYIENDSMTLGPIDKLMQSFVYVVTETCFWETKKHLTEKIFKPIVAKQPFLLLGCANNLEYLRSYGFKTFDRWWDESYDTIHDPVQRLRAVVDIIDHLCKLDISTLENMLKEMEDVLNYNHNLFFSTNFVDNAWNELQDKLTELVQQRF
jgi:hypothetical protein